MLCCVFAALRAIREGPWRRGARYTSCDRARRDLSRAMPLSPRELSHPKPLRRCDVGLRCWRLRVRCNEGFGVQVAALGARQTATGHAEILSHAKPPSRCDGGLRFRGFACDPRRASASMASGTSYTSCDRVRRDLSRAKPLSPCELCHAKPLSRCNVGLRFGASACDAMRSSACMLRPCRKTNCNRRRRELSHAKPPSRCDVVFACWRLCVRSEEVARVTRVVIGPTQGSVSHHSAESL